MLKAATIQELFEKQANLYPEKISIIYLDKKISYSSLNEIANQLAHFLRYKGVQPGDFIALCLNKNIEIFIAMLATLKIGAAFFLLNPEQLKGQTFSILKTIHAKHVISESSFLEYFMGYSSFVINFTNLFETLETYSKENPIINVNKDDYAYGVLTSGTTGNPKPVVITHQNLLDTYSSWRAVYNLSSLDIHLQMAAVGFDVFIGDWIRALCSGAQLVLCPKESLLQPKKLYDLIVTHKITCAEFVPVILRGLLNFLEENGSKLEQFRLLICGSDQWFMDEYRRVKRLGSTEIRVINSYGLSETTIDSTYFEETLDSTSLPSSSLVPLGKPFPHVKIYLLDEQLQPVPRDKEGEIYIGGTGVGRYLTQLPTTVGRFLSDPNQTDQKIYKTGDKGKLLRDGNFAFLGRNQLHIKYDGKRIDLATVEALLNQHPAISQSAVIPEITIKNKVSLTCFISVKNKLINYSELTGYLRDHIPDFTVPIKFYLVNKVALTLNDKIDRKVTSQRVIKEIKPEIISSNNLIQTELINLWKKFLLVEEIGIQNSFYELGGSSFLFVQMIESVNQHFGVFLPSTLRINTIKELSAIIQFIYDDAVPTASQEKLFIPRIAIIGGGPAAVSLCLQLFNQLKFRPIKSPLEIIVFEKTNTIGSGLPYAEKEPSYILNLPKDKMEAISDDEGRFATWLVKKYPDNPSSFSPRYFFGEYLQHRAKNLQKESEKYNIKVHYLTQNNVLNVSKLGTDCFSVETDRGGWQANYVVLCTGHMPSENYTQYIGQSGYWHNPWDNLAFSTIQNNESVGIIGTRLTAIDIVIRLLSQKHCGPIIMTSRNGLLPAVLAKSTPFYPLQYLKPTVISKTIGLNTLIKLLFKELSAAQGKQCSFNSIVRSYQDITALAWLKKEINEAEKGNKPWQQVLFSIYPSFHLIWSRLSLEDKKEFLLKYYSTFMTYLAAFPLDNAYKIWKPLELGQLKILGGFQSIKQQQEKYILQGKGGSFEVKHLFNATGSGHNIFCQSLYSKMHNQGLIRQHSLGGLEVDQRTLQVLNSRGQPNPRLFAIGELTRGNYLITADMGCVVNQARHVSQCISQGLTSNLNPKPSLGSSKSTFRFFSTSVYRKLIEPRVIVKHCFSLLIMRKGR